MQSTNNLVKYLKDKVTELESMNKEQGLVISKLSRDNSRYNKLIQDLRTIYAIFEDKQQSDMKWEDVYDFVSMLKREITIFDNSRE